MALRKPASSVRRLSHLFNSIASQKGANPFPQFSSVCSDVPQNTFDKVIPHQRLPPTSKGIETVLNRTDRLWNQNVLNISMKENISYEYKCPSNLTSRFSRLIILDRLTNTSDYHLPWGNTSITSLIDPKWRNSSIEVSDPLPAHQAPVKESKEILKIRHKKMKKHKLRKLRKRMYFLWRKQKMNRKAKRDAVYWKEIEDIKKEGDDFDAEAFVKDQLQKARRGGYFINVFDSKLPHHEQKKLN